MVPRAPRPRPAPDARPASRPRPGLRSPARPRPRAGTGPAAVAAIVAVAGSLAFAGPASAAGSTASPQTRAAFTLQARPGNAAAVRELAGRLPHASVGGVLASANRAVRPLAAGAPQRAADRFQAGFQFDAGDTSTSKWMPQGISGSGDASASGLVDGRRSLLVSWYAKGPDSTVSPGVRVSFISAEDLGKARYRHVLLVDPYRNPRTGRADFRYTPSHAGGIAWVGRWLYVAETSGGLSVYDTARMMKVAATSGNKDKVGCDPGPCEAADYQYVMPKVRTFLAAPQLQKPYGLRYSSVSYDAASSSLVTSEYRVPGKGGPTTRVLRWPLKGDGVLRSVKTAKGPRVVPSGAWTTDVRKVQGAMTRGSTLYLSTSGDGASRGLWQGRLGGALQRRAWPAWAEDLSFAPASGRVYSLTEDPGADRAVFAVGG